MIAAWLPLISMIPCPQESAPREKEIEGWVSRLDDDSPAVRDDAQSRLSGLAGTIEELLRSLEQAQEGSDAAVASGSRGMLVRLNALLASRSSDLEREKLGKLFFDEWADPTPEDRAIREKLASIRVTIDMEKAPLTSVVDYLRELSGLNMHISGIENADGEMLSVKLSDLPMGRVLKHVLRPRQWGFTVRDGVVLVTTQVALQRRVKLEIYDVQDLIVDAETFSGEDLIRLVQERVWKGLWRGEDGRSAQVQNGLLIVRNSLGVHRSLRRFLTRLRHLGLEAPSPTPRKEIEELILRLGHPNPLERRTAEKAILDLALDVRCSMDLLRKSVESPDAEVRLRSQELLQRTKEGIRSATLYDLRNTIREVRARWRDGDDEDPEEMIRTILAPYSPSRLRTATRREGGAAVPMTEEIAKALDAGEGIVLVRGGKPVQPPPGEPLDPRGESLIFTLSEGGSLGGGSGRAWNAFVVLEFPR